MQIALDIFNGLKISEQKKKKTNKKPSLGETIEDNVDKFCRKKKCLFRAISIIYVPLGL